MVGRTGCPRGGVRGRGAIKTFFYLAFCRASVVLARCCGAGCPTILFEQCARSNWSALQAVGAGWQWMHSWACTGGTPGGTVTRTGVTRLGDSGPRPHALLLYSLSALTLIAKVLESPVCTGPEENGNWNGREAHRSPS